MRKSVSSPPQAEYLPPSSVPPPPSRAGSAPRPAQESDRPRVSPPPLNRRIYRSRSRCYRFYPLYARQLKGLDRQRLKIRKTPRYILPREMIPPKHRKITPQRTTNATYSYCRASPNQIER